MKSCSWPLAAVLLAAASSQASAAEIQITAQNPVIELTVAQTVLSKPDLGLLTAGVSTRAMTALDSTRENARRMDVVITSLRQLGIAREDIQTSNFGINPQWQYAGDGKPPVFAGYEVTNQVAIKLRNLDKAGQVIEALVAAGANNFNQMQLMVEKDGAARSMARKAAFAEAGARGRELAGLAGYSGLNLLEVSESYASEPRSYSAGNDAAIVVTAMKAESVTPVELGQVATVATLTVKYEMTR